MEREALVGHGFKKEVDVATSQSQRLPGQLGHVYEVARRRRAHDPVHAGLDLGVDRR